MNFDWQPHTRLVFGANSAERVGELARELGGKKVLLVTDPGIITAGHAARAQESLAAAGFAVTIYGNCRENPTTKDVDACLVVARTAQADLIVAVGGGSSMDTAKGANFLLTNGGRMQDYQGIGKATRPMLPFIAIPTTAGTGSECQSFSLIADEQTHQKMACGDPKAAARVAILDPLLTLTQPSRVAACTGIDAIAHAVETAVTRKRTALSWLYSREAFKLTAENLPRVLESPQNIEARAAMQLGAAHAGTAIENSMLGAVHSAANPLTAHFGIVHGHAVGLMLPAVVRFNAVDTPTKALYDQLSPRLGDLLDDLFARTKLPKKLSDCGVPSTAIPKLAEEAARQWTAQFNPRPVKVADFIKLYEVIL
ncbi:MAG: iron-containing alcohol dehydrogenase [Methylacidiphilales bacterium]|nr:iron-containing alcohol dehydrogenase [Candidatus Methylacidiphilales bacterium]